MIRPDLKEGKPRIDKILKNAGNSILDVGCGSGRYVRSLLQRGYEAYGLDRAPRYYASVSSRQIMKGDACHLPFKDQSFDTILLLNVLEHVDDRAALREAYRVCKKNVIFGVPHEKERELGDFYVTYHPYVDPTHLRYYTVQSVKTTFTSAGFARVDVNYQGPINAAGLFLRALRVPRLPSMWVGAAINAIPMIKKYYANIEGIATKK